MNINFGRWFSIIYKEKDFGRSIATSLAGAAGLGIYLYWGDWVIAAFVLLIVYPAARIVASAIHSQRIQSREHNYSREQMKDLFENFGAEEKSVVQAFVYYGSTFIAWGDLDRCIGFSDAGIDSLIHRDLAYRTVTADGMREAFCLNTQLFDYAQSVLPKVPS